MQKLPALLNQRSPTTMIPAENKGPAAVVYEDTMRKIIAFLSVLGALALAVSGTTPVHAGGNACTLVAGLRAPFYIRVYDESSAGTNGVLLASERRMQRDETLSIGSSNGRIRYDYRYDTGSQWINVGAWCRNNDRITVP